MDARTAQPRSPAIARATPGLIAAQRGLSARTKAMLFVCLNLRGGLVEMRLPNGADLAFGDGEGPSVRLVIHSEAFARRVLRDGDIGFAESYIEGEWETPDFVALLSFFADNADRIARVFRGNVVSRALHFLRHLTRANTRRGARKNILAHYDLGNAFYEAWLDPSMTYSAARFGAGARDLESAQAAKYHALARLLALKEGDRVLEIGCGWGGFAEIAARDYGAHVTGLTLSPSQRSYAQARLDAQGLSDRVDIRLQDYRDATGAFDKIASIEMFEAVGEKYWPAFFETIAQRLKPGGRAALQIITIRDDLFAGYRARVDFIQQAVFPGGMLPSLARLRDETRAAGLAWDHHEAFGLDYADTLAAWARRFLNAWPDIAPLGFDERFKRLWRFYLGYCEAGFRTGRTDVVQIALAKP